MSRRHKRKRKGQEGVELNLAAMLDMAFQLLTFFILTFKPSSVEAELALNLPPPISVSNVAADPNSTGGGGQLAQHLETLPITVLASANGQVASVQIGTSKVFDGPATPENLRILGRRLERLFELESTPFDQVVVRVSNDLNYEELMKVIDVCSRQTLPDKTKLTKISFAPIADGSE